jgi:hypothetical protein
LDASVRGGVNSNLYIDKENEKYFPLHAKHFVLEVRNTCTFHTFNAKEFW